MAKNKKQKPRQAKVKETPQKTAVQIINEITKTEGIMNALGDGLTILDKTFKVLYENKVHRDMFGGQVGEHCYKAYQKRERICDGCPVVLTFKNGNVHTIQREVHTDKETKYFETTASPLRDTTGQIIAVIEVVRDITERKQIEEKLREGEERYRLLFNNVSDAIFVHEISSDLSDPSKLRIIEVNDIACQYLGYSREELLQMIISQIDAPETLANVPAILKKLFAEGHTTWEGIHVSKDGRKIPVEISNLLFELYGKQMILATVRDITVRKKAEEELKLSEEKFRALFEQAGDYAFILKPSAQAGLVIMDANEAACQMHGFTRDELVGMSISELDPELSNERISERLQLLLSGETLKFETVHYRKDGTSFPLEVCTKAVRIAGSPLLIFSTERDITDRKKAEEEKFRLEEQLQHAQKMEAIGTLAGGVAHDFNNLLTAIIGYGNLLKTEVGQSDLLMAYVTQILNSAERATHLTHNLLAFSRRQMIIPKPVNVNNIINGVKSFLPRIIGEDIEFSIFPTDQDLTVMADRHHIELVLINLATNARDAMPDGGRLTIRTECRELDNEFKKHGYGSTGSYAIISVEDTGHGMDEKTKERLFDPFYTTKEVGKGTGLGLSMVYGIIKQHNGYIDVQTEQGKGTTFNVYLPLTISKVEEDKKPEDLKILKGGNETILVAEDETYVRDFIKEILTGYGYKVIEAIDGEDAIKILYTHKDKIQLSLLDVVMPKKDGKVVYEEIKKVSPHMKVIFISGYATDILHKKGIIEEGIIFISKPMSPDNLLIKVRAVLDS